MREKTEKKCILTKNTLLTILRTETYVGLTMLRVLKTILVSTYSVPQWETGERSSVTLTHLIL